jgi:DNA-binding transcriptional MerR regulator
MSVRLPIGDFAKMTHLSVKALRRYHDMGLLRPAVVDRASGYRYYEPNQVATGQVIRRFRDLGMPLQAIKDVLHTPDAALRSELITAHLRRMEQTLEDTQRSVASLRALLESPTASTAVEYRSVPATPALAITEPVAMEDIEAWWEETFADLHAQIVAIGAERNGPDGALYPSEFFEDEIGEVVAFIPVIGQPDVSDRASVVEIPAAELAVTVHHGPFGDLDRAYGALGTYVAEREIGVDGPIREHYLVTADDTDDESRHKAEVCWPVFHTKDTPPR